MSKDIKDYIHLYMGRPYWTSNSQGELNAYTLRYVLEMIKGGKEVQLHLRRIEDMTEEEALALYRIYDKTADDYLRRFSEQCPGETFSALNYLKEGRYVNSIWSISTQPAEAFHYLLSKGFDLFGLIDSGAALDAKTLQTQQQ